MVVSDRPSVIVVGSGVFGVTGACELARRGCTVTLIDSAPVPAPLAASTDISKVVRLEYGADAFYMELMEEAREGWLRWNDRWGEAVYVETGVLMMSRETMAPGQFEFESYKLLNERGHKPKRIRSEDLARRFARWSPTAFKDGFFHSIGGYARSGRVVELLKTEAQNLGVRLIEGRAVASVRSADAKSPPRVILEDETLASDRVVVAAGAWTPELLPETAGFFRVLGQPVFHLKPISPDGFRPPDFPVFTADIARTGWYGFPANEEGIVKLANHGPGREIEVGAPRTTSDAEEARLRDFLADAFPQLADAPIIESKLCLYCDSPDGDFWISRVPGKPGVTVAGGGSGHGFKFAPVLGGLIADAALGIENPRLKRFEWSDKRKNPVRGEAARWSGDDA